MASVRNEIIDFLVDEFDCDRPSATKAVEKAVEADDIQGKEVEDMAEHIYNKQRFWE